MGSPLSGRAARVAVCSSKASFSPAAGEKCESTRAPSVMVPVLSETIQVMRPMFSTATPRRTSAFLRASRKTPMPRKKV